jgi:hypothetical protein
VAIRRPEEVAQALWYSGPGQAEIRQETLAPPKAGEVRVRALYGAVSRGTEALVLAGRVPQSEFERMRAPFMAGNFPFPVKYGYATVGRIEGGTEALRGRTVFTLHPHQNFFNIAASAAVVLPENLPPQRAVLAANMETALNAVWDAAPGPADRIAIVGAGVVGSLVAYLCGRIPGTEVTLVDINPARAELAQTLGVSFAKPETAKDDCDLVVHASGNAAGLGTALALAGEEATVLELSWYGWCRARLDGSRHRTGRAGRMAGGSPRRSLCWPMHGSTHCWSRRLDFRIWRSGYPIFSTPGVAYFVSPSLTKEVPCSPLKSAITS